jgi:predicted DCC family thiol-disulfide oxidoreductase YuxK
MGKVILYDGDCPFCRTLSAFLSRRPGVSRRDARETHAEEARNEVLVIDEETGEVQRGFAGLLAVFEGRWWAAVLRLPPLRGPLSLLYRLVARNRRLLLPPAPRPIRCACDPDPSLADRIGLLALLLTFAAGTALVLARGTGLPPWSALAAFALPLLAESPHAVVILGSASGVLLPGALLSLALGPAPGIVTGAAALLAAARMALHRRALVARPRLFLAGSALGYAAAVALLMLAG